MDMEMFQEAELQDALSACDQLHNILARLKRLGLLTDEEDQETKERIDEISETLAKKLPADD